jgi:predicted permease
MSSKNERDDKGSNFFILGILAAMFLWTAGWQLCDLLLKRKKASTQIFAYFVIFILALAALCYLNKKDPKFIGF